MYRERRATSLKSGCIPSFEKHARSTVELVGGWNCKIERVGISRYNAKQRTHCDRIDQSVGADTRMKHGPSVLGSEFGGPQRKDLQKSQCGL